MSDTRDGEMAGVPLPQRTLKHSIHCSGVSLHRGSRVHLSMHPAEPNTGIVFRRTDIGGGNALIAASWSNVVDSALCTTLRNEDGVTIATVEHLLSALAGCGIDNLLVEVQGPELPIMDGSAWPFVFLAECAGIAEQDEPKRGIEILRRIQVSAGGRSASLSPDCEFSVSVHLEYECPAIGRQDYAVRLGNGTFKAEISRARTYGFLHEVDSLRAAGLARGASLDNAVVVSGETVLNEGGLRYPDEFARHKVLDIIGDLALAGAPMIGHFHGHCSGHKLNHRLLHELFTQRKAWRLTPITAVDETANRATEADRAAVGA